MQILRAETTGMCFGVRDALKTIERLDRPEDVTIHGELVHNEAVLVQLGVRGFRMTGEDDRTELPVTPNILVTAHGISDTERTRLKSAGKQVIDTTCPLVTRVHQAAQALQRDGYYVLVLGRRRHVEVRGIIEDLSEYEVIENEDEVGTYPWDRLGVVCQTTTPLATVKAVQLLLAIRNPDAEIRFLDTSCAPTRDNQRALDELLPKVEAMVVVGGNNSNNTRELAARCRAANKPVMHVQGAAGLRRDWFRGLRSVGLAAGTSTLDATLDEVELRLREIATTTAEPVAPSRVWTSAEWLQYYQANAKHLMPIPWQVGAGVTLAELEPIVESLRAWQLGETSEGGHLLAATRKYALRMGDPLFVDVVRMFIAEEQRHGEDLGRFLDLAGVPRAKRNWGDSLFRAARYCITSMEAWVTPVVMVETHGLIYYNAIRRATRSKVLRTLCQQILRDEIPHIRFQCERLAILHRGRSRPWMLLTKLFHRIFFTLITLLIWVGHRRALRAGGYTFRQFWRSAWGKMSYAWRIMRPEHYV
ncbi:MAG: 4-hydroxy-3-methylbut-2-enyl diphosphate reductase [Gemmataceae bacterium]